jgi:16S rRNA (adenine(1408)-N(1))-methyltransferase
VTIDVGTGDGRAVLDLATREPATLVLGLDASAAAMVESSRRAAGPARKGGRPNARFILAAAESPPPALVGVADLVTVRFPWGSLLRGCLGSDAAVAAGVAALVAPGGVLELLLAPSARDGLEGVPIAVEDIVRAAGATFAAHGFEVAVGRMATAAEIAASGSTWAKRLAAGRHGARVNGSGNGASNGDAGRSATLVRLVRPERR